MVRPAWSTRKGDVDRCCRRSCCSCSRCWHQCWSKVVRPSSVVAAFAAAASAVPAASAVALPSPFAFALAFASAFALASLSALASSFLLAPPFVALASAVALASSSALALLSDVLPASDVPAASHAAAAISPATSPESPAETVAMTTCRMVMILAIRESSTDSPIFSFEPAFWMDIFPDRPPSPCHCCIWHT